MPAISSVAMEQCIVGFVFPAKLWSRRVGSRMKGGESKSNT